MSIVTNQLIEFIQFILIGLVISVIFDFFRAYRVAKKPNNLIVFIQDFIYFFIVTIIIICSIINVSDSSLRFYIFIALILGISIYMSVLSQFFMKLYDKIFKVINFIFDLFILPLKLLFQFMQKIYKFFEKYIKKCCKMFLYMVSLICNKLLKLRLPKIKFKKRGLKNK